MKTGDILLVGYKKDPISWLIRKYIHCEYNHVAWILNDFMVYEVRARGISINHIDKYKNKKLYGVKIMRIPKLTQKDFIIPMEFVYARMKTHSICDYIALVISAIYEIKFKGLYTCSGLIAVALSKIGWYFNPNKTPYFITPTDIEKTKELIDVTKEF